MRRKKVDKLQSVHVEFKGGEIKIVGGDEKAAEDMKKTPLKAVHPNLMNFNAENIEPEVLGTALDDVLGIEPDILAGEEFTCHSPDMYEPKPLQRNGSGSINLSMRIK